MRNVEINTMTIIRGIECSCKSCGSILSKGKTVIEVVIGGRIAILEMDPLPVCCGEEKEFPMVFANQVVASAFAMDLKTKIQIEGTRFLQLLDPQTISGYPDKNERTGYN